jgi:transposase
MTIIVGLVLCVAFVVTITLFSTALGQKTCPECGGGLPVTRSSKSAEGTAWDDWVCSKCGTRFDRQARVRI